MTTGGVRPPAGPFADEAFAAAADGYANTPESWELAIHAAIAGLFGFLADRPAETKACILDDPGATSASLARRDRTIDRFTELLQPGIEKAPVPPPPVVAEAIGGGIYELIRRHVLERRLHELPVAIPDATVVALAPFLGAAGAIELVEATNVQANR